MAAMALPGHLVRAHPSPLGLHPSTQLLFINRQGRLALVVQWYGIHMPIQDTQVQFLHQETPLEKGMATHSSILAWEIPWTESLGATVRGVTK